MAKATSAKKIAVIGGGHMGAALVEGLVRSGVRRSRILVSNSAGGNARVIARADVIFIAVKPGVVRDVFAQARGRLRGKLVVSLATGVSLAKLRAWTERGARVARVMPNIPVSVQEGVVGIFARGADAALLNRMLKGLGLVIRVKSERELDVLTLVAGCGPGIAAYCIDALARAGAGEETALAVFKGAAAYLAESGFSSRALMKSVATKGGVTEAILKTLARERVAERMGRALAVGRKRLKKIHV